MKLSFPATLKFSAFLDDWIVIITDNIDNQVRIYNTESWLEWGDCGVKPENELSTEYTENCKNSVICKAISLYQFECKHS